MKNKLLFIVLSIASIGVSFSQTTPKNNFSGGGCDTTCINPGSAILNVPPSPPMAPLLLRFDGVCGPENGRNLKVAPVSGALNLCSSGTKSAISGSGPWNWTCTGINSAVNASCSANLIVDGVCGTDNGTTIPIPPTNLCAAGNPSPVISTGAGYTWTCTGLNTGTTAGCSALKTPPIGVGGNCYGQGTDIICVSATKGNLCQFYEVSGNWVFQRAYTGSFIAQYSATKYDVRTVKDGINLALTNYTPNTLWPFYDVFVYMTMNGKELNILVETLNVTAYLLRNPAHTKSAEIYCNANY